MCVEIEPWVVVAGLCLVWGATKEIGWVAGALTALALLLAGVSHYGLEQKKKRS